MQKYQLSINGTNVEVVATADTPLLWILRDHLRLTGTKFGCGGGHCGACTVHVDGQAIRSCSYPVGSLAQRNVTTIEGLGATSLHPVQQAWIKYDVPQCGYCQPGQMMQAAALLAQQPTASDAEIDTAMRGNICRCGTYPRIREAIRFVVLQNRSNGLGVGK